MQKKFFNSSIKAKRFCHSQQLKSGASSESLWSWVDKNGLHTAGATANRSAITLTIQGSSHLIRSNICTHCRCAGIWCRVSLRAGSESSCTVRCGPGPLRSGSVGVPPGGAGPSRPSRSPSTSLTRRCPGSRTAWWHHRPFAHTGSEQLETDRRSSVSG